MVKTRPPDATRLFGLQGRALPYDNGRSEDPTIIVHPRDESYATARLEMPRSRFSPNSFRQSARIASSSR